MEEPTDEMLQAIMEQVAESARRSTAKFQAELHRRFEAIRMSNNAYMSNSLTKHDARCHPFILESSRKVKYNIPWKEPNFSLYSYVDPTAMERRAVVRPAGIAAGRRNKHCFRCPSLVPPPIRWVGDLERGKSLAIPLIPPPNNQAAYIIH